MLFSIMEAWILSQSLAVLALLGEFMLAGEVSRDLGRLVGTLQNVEPKIWFLSLLGDPEVNSSKAREFLAIVVPMGSRFVEGATRNLMGVSSCLAGQNEIAYERLGEAIEILSTNTGYSECHLYSPRIVHGLLEHRLMRKRAISTSLF